MALPWQNCSYEELPPKMLYSRRIFEYYATYLTRHYKIKDADGNLRHYAKDSVLKRLNQSVHRAKKDYGKASPEAELLFTCLNPRGQTEDAHWFRAMKEVITKEIFQRNVDHNENMDFSSVPVYTKEISEMNRNLALEGSDEAVCRAFELTCLVQCAGRTTECSFINLNNFRHDIVEHKEMAIHPQSKVSKLKTVGFHCR